MARAKMRSSTSLAMLVATGIALRLLAVLAADPPEAAPPIVKVTISKESTYITKPLRPDGYPDYVAALNEICSRGVTPKNNAAVLLQKAFGPRDSAANIPGKLLKELGIDDLPEKGDYFQDSDVIIHQWLLAWPEAERDQQYDVLDTQFDIAKTSPWTADQHRWFLNISLRFPRIVSAPMVRRFAIAARKTLIYSGASAQRN
jgi:hypothetical protein